VGHPSLISDGPCVATDERVRARRTRPASLPDHAPLAESAIDRRTGGAVGEELVKRNRAIVKYRHRITSWSS
jgi:hypothetical protein